MNIAILSDRLTVGGGTEAYLRSLITDMLQQGDRVSVLTAKVNVDPQFLAQHNLTVLKSNLAACPKKLRHIFFDHFLQRELAKQTFDLILGITTPYSPQIGICCGTYKGDMEAMSQRRINPLNHVRVHYEKKKYHGSQIIAAHSDVLKEELIRLHGLPENKIRVIYPSIESGKFQQKNEKSRALYREKYKIDNTSFNALFVSTGHLRKGLQIIIEAAEKLKNKSIQFIVAGSPQGNFPSSPYVRYLGYVKNMQELYHACDTVLLPAYYEPFGLVVIESLQCGTPVIVSSKVGAKELLDKDLGIVLDVLNKDCLADAIHQLFVHPLIPATTKVESIEKQLADHAAKLKALV